MPHDEDPVKLYKHHRVFIVWHVPFSQETHSVPHPAHSRLQTSCLCLNQKIHKQSFPNFITVQALVDCCGFQYEVVMRSNTSCDIVTSAWHHEKMLAACVRSGCPTALPGQRRHAKCHALYTSARHMTWHGRQKHFAADLASCGFSQPSRWWPHRSTGNRSSSFSSKHDASS